MVIQSHRGPYTLKFGRQFEGIDQGLNPGEHLIIDDRVAELYAETLQSSLDAHSVLRITANEKNKSLERISDYVTCLLENGVRRNHVLVAVGGGIIQDITAFIAATLLRGLDWRFYPTTLLAQADSCIGSKSSINVGRFKNQVGTFTPPNDILVSTSVLRTLTDQDLRSGVGEMIKVHIISGLDDLRAIQKDYPNLFEDPALMEHYIHRSLEIKKAKIEVDEFDRNERLVMNYGHSFGHAIESASEYQIPHGIAVTIGMDLANYLACRLQLTSSDVHKEIHQLLRANYSGFERCEISSSQFFAALNHDKKNKENLLSLILMSSPGEMILHRIPLDDQLKGICLEYFEELRTVRQSISS